MSNYSQQEDAYDRYEEKILMLSSFIYAIGYGAQLVLYSNCVSLFWKQRNSQRKHACIHLAYITLIFILETLVMATAIWVLVNLYINDRDYPGGPMAYYLTAQPIGSTIFGSFFALNFMCDWLIFWRCWVIWRPAGKLAAYAVLCLPVLMVLSASAFGIVWAYRIRQSGLSLYSRLSLAVGIGYSVSSLGANILLTILIIVRLLLYRRSVMKALPVDYTKHYLSLATIVIESVLPYSLFGAGFIITYAINNPLYRIFLYLSSTCQPIGASMIILRVAQGRAWTTNTLALATTSTNVRFNQPDSSTQGIVESRLDHPCNRVIDYDVETGS